MATLVSSSSPRITTTLRSYHLVEISVLSAWPSWFSYLTPTSPSDLSYNDVGPKSRS